MKPWGYHLILDCGGCDRASINSRDNIAAFNKELVERIKMTAIGDPIIELTCVGLPNEGWSLLQLIATSNVAVHFANDTNAAYVDVFSCKEFDNNEVIDVVNKYFKPTSISRRFLHRQA